MLPRMSIRTHTQLALALPLGNYLHCHLAALEQKLTA